MSVFEAIMLDHIYSLININKHDLIILRSSKSLRCYTRNDSILGSIILDDNGITILRFTTRLNYVVYTDEKFIEIFDKEVYRIRALFYSGCDIS